jgi:hypothetical protein
MWCRERVGENEAKERGRRVRRRCREDNNKKQNEPHTHIWGSTATSWQPEFRENHLPAFRGKPRFCEKDTVKRRKEKNDERKQQTNGKPWMSRITLRLKSPDALSSRLQTLQRVFASKTCLRHFLRIPAPISGNLYSYRISLSWGVPTPFHRSLSFIF